MTSMSCSVEGILPQNMRNRVISIAIWSCISVEQDEGDTAALSTSSRQRGNVIDHHLRGYTGYPVQGRSLSLHLQEKPL